MFRKTLAVAGVTAVAAGSAVSAVAATTHATKHKISVTAKVALVKSAAGVLTFKGTTTGTGGKGTVTVVQKIVSATKSTSTSVTKYKHGSVTFKFTATQTAGATGYTITGTGHAVKGTGIYKGVTGTLKLTGTAPTSLKTAAFKVTGTLKY